MTSSRAIAIFGNQMATGFLGATEDPADLDGEGLWAVTQTFEGKFRAFRFEKLEPIDESIVSAATHHGIPVTTWQSSMSQTEYENAVAVIRSDIERGWVYQANLCRVLSAPLENELDVVGLWSLMRKNNPAPYLSALQVPAELSGFAESTRVVCVSPELFLERRGDLIRSSPIKGTAKVAEELLEKDRAENVMIVDLVRNDLGHVCEPGSVSVPDLLRIEKHPGLVHLVSDVEGRLPADATWAEIFSATAPPGSVSGAPKSSALEVIARLEKTERNIYCGGFGWIDGTERTAKLAVGIRTFWQSKSDTGWQLNFGTGAGITWGSDPTGEWNETELKAAHLLSVAAMELG